MEHLPALEVLSLDCRIVEAPIASHSLTKLSFYNISGCPFPVRFGLLILQQNHVIAALHWSLVPVLANQIEPCHAALLLCTRLLSRSQTRMVAFLPCCAGGNRPGRSWGSVPD